MILFTGDVMEAKKLILANGINSKSDIETIISNEARKRGLKIADIEERQGGSSLSLNDLETISSIPLKDVSSRKNGSTTCDTIEGLVKVAKGASCFNVKANGDLSNSHNSTLSTTKRSKNKQKPPESDYELDISDSEDSISSSRVSQDSSPKSNRTNKTDNTVAMKLKEEQVQRYDVFPQIQKYKVI